MRVLYIEDDFIDQQNMFYICKNNSKIDLHILDSYKKVAEFLKNNPRDIIIADQYVGHEHINDYYETFGTTPFVVLSNSVPKTDHWIKTPITVYEKPFSENKLNKLLNTTNQNILNGHNLDFFSSFPKESAKELKRLMLQEFKAFNEKAITALDHKNIEELALIIHKISSKFSILQDKKTFDMSKSTEKNLNDGQIIKSDIFFIINKSKQVVEYLENN